MNNEEIKLWVKDNYYRVDGKPNSNLSRRAYCAQCSIKLDFYDSVMYLTQWLDNHNPRFNDRVRSILLDKSTIDKCECGNDVKLNWDLSDTDNLFNKFCCTKCAKNSNATKVKYENTCIDRFGVSNVAKSPEVAKKIGDRLRTPFTDAVTRYKTHYGDKFTYMQAQNNTVDVHCTLHDITFNRSSSSLLSGETNCPECRADALRNKYTMTKDEFIQRLADLRGSEISLSGEYFGMHSISKFVCNEGHTFECKANHIAGSNLGNCPYCYSGTSKQEQDLIAFIRSLEVDVIAGSRKHLGNGKEIDAIVGNKMFEYNGLHWHSDDYLTRTYHLSKTTIAEERGYQLFHIWSHEWLNETKRDIWKSIIKNSLQLADRKLYARKCVVRDVEYSEYRSFMEMNHIQGSSNAKHRLGLYYDDELVSCMGFSIPRFASDCDIELVRFANAKYTSVVGGASKLLKHFMRLNEGKSIVSYADRRLSSGNLYKQLGFKFSHHSRPSYFYTKDGLNVLSRYATQRKHLPKLLNDFNQSLSEALNMKNNGYSRIFDCGVSVWVLQ